MMTPVHTCACGEHAWFCATLGYVCFVDTGLAPAFSAFRWHALRDNGNVYVARASSSTHEGRRISHKAYAHQLVLPLPHRLVVDHKDGNGLNNRKSNLRPMTARANAHQQAKKKGCSSRYKGVSHRGGKWYAYINIEGQQVGLGLYEQEIDAARAYNRAAAARYGNHASLNATEAA